MEERIEQQQQQNEQEIDLRVIFGILRKNLILIIIVTVVFGIGTYFYSSFEYYSIKKEERLCAPVFF